MLHTPPTVIRDATHADIPVLLDMGARFAEATGLSDIIPFDAETVERLFIHLIESDDGILLVMDGGAVGALMFPAMINGNHRTAQELFWWVDPDKRGNGSRLVTALESTARERGAKSLIMSTIGDLDREELARFYERRGYRPADRNFLRAL